ncbi:hypothetical protein [Trujillonella humicola]|uniref:hypothetical protein n=1 Tax=Trujillonella humicola TaxID=3383699 RepID=UPI003906CA2C
MTAPRDPWADPDTPTEQGAPYAGPPPYPAAYPGAVYAQPPQGHPGYGWPAYGQPGYGWPPGYGGWPPPPAGPRRPGQVVTAAVLALVQAGLVAFASAYVLLFASVLGFDLDLNGTVDSRAQSIADEARVLAWVQFASVVLLVAAGVLALNRRDRRAWTALVAALAVQVLLALYWAVRIVGVLDDLPGPNDGAVGVLVFGAVCFGTGPAVGLGLLLTRPAREWFGAGGPATAG